MIHIDKDADVIENPNIKVATATGDYEDSALIEVYNIDTPDIVAGAFQAQYIKYGSMVYGFNSHMELGAAILRIDPQATHTSASYVRMSRELLSQMNGGSLEATSLDEVISVEKKNIEEQIGNTPEPETPVEVPEEVPAEEVVTPAPEEVLPEEPVITPTEPEVVPEVVIPTPEEVVTPPVVEVVPEPVIPPAEEVIEVIIPDVEEVLTEPVTGLIRKASRRKLA